MKQVGKAAKASVGMQCTRRTESEKEKTKMRERQRRAITTNIFHGLRKHGGYLLSPRADINEVLRELAKEAGWVVLPDGTTYRSFSSPHGWGCCPVCGSSWRASNNSATPSSTVVVGDGGGGGGGGEYCSTTASPLRDSMNNNNSNGGGGSTVISSLYVPVGGGASADGDIPIDQLCMYGGLSGCGGGGPMGLGHVYPEQLYVQEARASNQNTPDGSPLRRA
ncbi:protein BZR1 homolog 2-like [Corylus avellana]|uniref:protein BZR1 homolog 2-like n=1 Tax=Corylus avellana TaxID=13451 RepID=UPI00286AB2E8|nr:protein BZR1 homolog 2-like [Corylus avellana]